MRQKVRETDGPKALKPPPLRKTIHGGSGFSPKIVQMAVLTTAFDPLESAHALSFHLPDSLLDSNGPIAPDNPENAGRCEDILGTAALRHLLGESVGQFEIFDGVPVVCGEEGLQKDVGDPKPAALLIVRRFDDFLADGFADEVLGPGQVGFPGHGRLASSENGGISRDDGPPPFSSEGGNRRDGLDRCVFFLRH